MSTVTLTAEKREKFGSAESNKIKRSGRIPAIVYSKEGNINFSLNRKEFEKEYFQGNSLSSVVNIELAGKKIKAIAHKIDLDPVTDKPIHIDFLSCDDGNSVRAKPKISFTNQDKSPGLKKGGFLHIVLRRAEVICEGISRESVPQSLEIDIGSLHMGSKIRAESVVLPTGVKFLEKGNFLIASIIGRGKSEEEEKSTTTATSTTTTAAPAAKTADSGEKKPADKSNKK